MSLVTSDYKGILMATGSERTAAWRKRQKEAQIGQLNLTIPAEYHDAFRRMAQRISEQREAIAADGPLEFILCYRDRGGRLRHWFE